MIEIFPGINNRCEVSVPGSKSYTHRLLIASALSDGICTIKNCLRSEDTLLTLEALRKMGADIDDSAGEITVCGTKGDLKAYNEPVFLGNSGTSMRLLTGVAALGSGCYTLTGASRMSERPIGDLLDGLKSLGVDARSLNNNGCPPLVIKGGKIMGGRIGLKCGLSSQFLSSILLIAPYTEKGVEIKVVEGPVSKPYIDMTIDIMAKSGVSVKRDGYLRFSVKGGGCYRAGNHYVEPDCSQAGYFWAAAAVTGAEIKVRGITKDSRQGDLNLTGLLEKMGCKIISEKDGISVRGGSLVAIEADMADMPDMVPTLAVVASFAKGTTVIKNVGHLKEKESDRLLAVVNELSKTGIEAGCTETDLFIKGGAHRGAEIDTYNDHRIAMSFAIAGLKVPGVFIKNEKCVEKSFPDFWKVLEALGRQTG
ncbi:MAG: 3-phosphoshikimate 1-carboxyvinyltransferase [Desulfobacteraceae bacterium]|nr:MAG: 3-phosphoshikimate 1-carboxyvinyltransferase [Desulfobacteraceae bacterium]